MTQNDRKMKFKKGAGACTAQCALNDIFGQSWLLTNPSVENAN